MLLKSRFVIRLIIIFSFTFNNAYSEDFVISDEIKPYCNGVGADQFLKDKKIKNIEIFIDNRRKWVKTIFSALVELNSESSKTENKNWFDYRIKEKYKKYFKSKVIVNFKDNKISCKFKAKIKITGDLWWHLDWEKGSALTSIQVKLLEGHINNITRFKLFLPSAREGGNNEIFVSSLLTELGFLAPRTQMVFSKVNGISGNYIFQEDLRKEFLENMKLVEGPLLEGDERLTIMMKHNKMEPSLSLSRIINKKFSLRDETSQKTALSAVANLNLIYLQHHQSKTSKKEFYLPTDRLHVNTDSFFLNIDNKKKFQTYDALVYALDAFHSLSYDDRRFYYDPINQNYIPIYYDGKSKITNDIQKSKLASLSKKVSIDSQKGAKNALNLIKKLNHNKFKEKLNNNGVSFSDKDYKKLIEKIISRLKVIKNATPNQVKFLETKKYFSNLNKNVIKNRKLIFVNLNKKEFYICSFNLDDCLLKKNTQGKFNKLLADILSQRFVEKNKSVLKNAENLFVYDNLNYYGSIPSISNIWKIKKINDDFSIKHNNEITITVSSDKKEIIINQTSNSGRAIIVGKKVDNWNIFFNGSAKKKINLKVPKNYLNLTGCLTFIDINVKDVNLNSKNSICEDSINFIRVNGSIDTVNITDSFFDALDLDFSNIKINSANINYAGNDCLDLSKGNYTINNIIVKSCGDKGISIGEKSKVILKQVEVNKSVIAIAAKDSSLVKIDKSQILNSKICFSAYRKKQEFSGAKIEIIQTNCNKEKFYVQQGSKIILGL